MGNFMKNETLYEKLKSYVSEDYYPFHMPGHKRNTNESLKLSPYDYDITEIDGFDNLHAPTGILRERMEKVSTFYESKKSYYLVNGSTCGILASISACCHRADVSDEKNDIIIKKNKIIMARNSHKAAYNSVLINELEALYVYPDLIEEYGINGGISPEKIAEIIKKEMLEENTSSIGCVYITSPTYEGVVSDILSISKICHSYNIPLVVDEAHGAHFSMHKDFPISALELGADIVIQSLHKTLPSLTQTSILHIGKNAIVDEREIERYLRIFQTSSPSYVLMASIDECIGKLMEDTFMPFDRLKKELREVYARAEKFTNIRLMGRDIIGKSSVYDFDISKLVIFPKSNQYNGQTLYKKLLEKYHLQMEMASLNYIMAMTSINDTKEGFERLFNALDDIDREIRLYELPLFKEKKFSIKKVSEAMAISKISDAIIRKKEFIDIDKAEGRVGAEFVYLYPPGIPIIAPGEMYSGEIIRYLKECIQNGLNALGVSEDKKQVSVIVEGWSSLEFKRLSLYDLF